MGVYDRQIASAARAIATKGEACVWKLPAPADTDAAPWRDVRDGVPTDKDVSIAWFSERDLGRGSSEFAALLAGTEVPQGCEVGLMAGGLDFEPLESHTIVRSDTKTYEIEKLDRLAPNGTPILFYVTVKR